MSDLFPIRTVSQLTGVKPVTLRAWERRYGLVKPVRTETGRRMYTREHIDALHRIRRLLEQGISIGQVARNPESKVQRERSADAWQALRARMATAVSRFDEAGLEEAYDEALAVHPLGQVTRRVLVPLLAELGDRWESSEGSVAEEHFFAMYLRNKIGARFHHRSVAKTGPKLLGACAPGEHHEIGLLLFALEAHAEGLNSVLLGANMPPDEIPLACRRSRSDAIVLSSSVEPSPEFIHEQLPKLVTRAGKPVFVGGHTSVRRRDEIVAAGAIPLGADISVAVRRIHELLPSRKEKQ
jgi:DNA-binding transcriptional MerR regulator